jgi:hypothetical protein
MALIRKDLEKAASVQDVTRILEELLAHEAAVDDRLTVLMDNLNQPDSSALMGIRESGDIEGAIAELFERVGPTAETASALSERVRRLDVEQARVKESLKYVEDVQVLKVGLSFDCWRSDG